MGREDEPGRTSETLFLDNRASRGLRGSPRLSSTGRRHPSLAFVGSLSLLRWIPRGRGRGSRSYGAVQYSRSGCPDTDVRTSRFEPPSQSLGPLGAKARSSAISTFKATMTFKRALKDSGTRDLGPAEEFGNLQQTGQERAEALRAP